MGALSAALAGALVVAATALATSGLAAKVVRWNETSSIGGSPVMNYQVTRLTVSSKGWSAHLAIRNLTKQTVFIEAEFELDLFASPSDAVNPFIRAGVKTYTPALPYKLGPGKSWSGVVRNAHALKLGNQKLYARVTFGTFQAGPNTWGWLTNHSLLIQPGAGTVI